MAVDLLIKHSKVVFWLWTCSLPLKQPNSAGHFLRLRLWWWRHGSRAQARFYWKRCINDLLLFAETRFCDSSQMKSMADFGPTREGDQLRARDPRRKKIILESKSTKSSLSTSDIAVEAGCTSGYVCRVLKAKANEEQPSCPAQATETGAPHEAPEKYENWFQSVIETHFPDLKAALCTCVRETPEQKSQKY